MRFSPGGSGWKLFITIIAYHYNCDNHYYCLNNGIMQCYSLYHLLIFFLPDAHNFNFIVSFCSGMTVRPNLLIEVSVKSESWYVLPKQAFQSQSEFSQQQTWFSGSVTNQKIVTMSQAEQTISDVSLPNRAW